MMDKEFPFIPEGPRELIVTLRSADISPIDLFQTASPFYDDLKKPERKDRSSRSGIHTQLLNLYMVVVSYFSPGFSSVEVKPGWFTASGMHWVSRHTAQ